MSEWMPIETAPKDGTHILAYWPQHPYGEDDNLDESKVVGGTQCVTFFSGGGWCEPDYLEAVGAYYFDDHAYAAQPTYWMPLPPPLQGA